MTTYADYAEARDDPRFTAWLRSRAAPSWTRATEHRFVTELASGAVDDAVSRRYLVQDYAFVTTLTGLVGHAAGDAPSVARHFRRAVDLEVDFFDAAYDR